MIQIVGNWSIQKHRKSYDTFKCQQCGDCLLIYKYQSFCEAKLVPKCSIKADWSFDADLVSKSDEKTHKPFDVRHLRVFGKTHASVRYFTKKHLNLSANAIIHRLKLVYPTLAKFFVPEIRKVSRIAERERKFQNDSHRLSREETSTNRDIPDGMRKRK